MFKFTRKDEPDLNPAITTLLNEMEAYDADSEEYQKRLAVVERLMSMKVTTHRQLVSLDTALTVAGNLLGILVIVAYEQRHVMTSKGLGFVMKAK